MSFRFGNLDSIGNTFHVALPKDEGGFIGRECSAKGCLGYFKVKPGTGLKGPGLKCHCPYCGHSGDPNTFFTPEQIEYAKSVAVQKITAALRKDLKQLEFDHAPKGGFGIGISMKLKEGSPPPIRYYREKKLETDVVCARCTLQYSVFGLFAYCPDCGVHNSLQVLEGNLVLIEKQLDLASTIESQELSRHLIEDALENCVSAFDGFARETCRVRAERSTESKRATTLSFQNLEGACSALKTLFSVDLASVVDPQQWDQAKRGFSKRNLLAHRSGIIDERYVQTSGDSSAVVGRRVVITAKEVTAVAEAVSALGHTLVGVLP